MSFWGFLSRFRGRRAESTKTPGPATIGSTALAELPDETETSVPEPVRDEPVSEVTEVAPAVEHTAPVAERRPAQMPRSVPAGWFHPDEVTSVQNVHDETDLARTIGRHIPGATHAEVLFRYHLSRAIFAVLCGSGGISCFWRKIARER